MSHLNPARRYNPADVPAKGDNRSPRFFPLSHSPSGIAQAPGSTLAGIAEQLADARAKEREPVEPQRQTVTLKKVVRDADGSYRHADGGTVEGPLVFKNTRPSLRGFKSNLTGGALVEDFLLGGATYAKAPDDVIFNALLVLVEDIGITGNDLRRLHIVVASALVTRAGLASPHPSTIP